MIHRDQGPVAHNVTQIDIDPVEMDLGAYPHYMLKEIFEQPETLENTMRGRLSKDEASAHLGGLNLTPQQLRSVDRIVITACGTSWHAALVGDLSTKSRVSASSSASLLGGFPARMSSIGSMMPRPNR